jgi:hypothetical protein
MCRVSDTVMNIWCLNDWKGQEANIIYLNGHAHTHTHAHTRTRIHTHTHTHTHLQRPTTVLVDILSVYIFVLQTFFAAFLYYV